jgi:hypothetical protein
MAGIMSPQFPPRTVMAFVDADYLIADGRDLAEALRVIADDHAQRVILFSVEGSPRAKELVQAADD